ncbi:MAG: hypothetical protein QOE61_1770 [Micromonosporaceae bacterium]|jgi:hypothetical protein|nr:hypothetical protein [Micromonosporaceae bacterium]
MTNATAVVRPLPGSGLVVRAGDLLLVCADGGQEVDDLLGLVAEVADAGGDGGLLVRRVAALLAGDFDGRFPACAASGPTRDGRLAVLVYGTATADVVSGDGDISLAGSDAITSVNRLISGSISAIRLQLPGAGPADSRSRLDSGVIGAAGVLYSAVADSSVSSFGAAPSPESSFGIAPDSSSMLDSVPEPLVPPEPPVPSELPVPPEPLDQPAPPAAPVVAALVVAAPEPAGEGPPMRQPDPAAPFVAVLLGPGAEAIDPAELPAPVLDMRPKVLGVLCKNDHFNDPSLRYCSVCGISMAQQTLVQHEGPRPPLGVLLLDDGSTFRLDLDYIVGREPQADPEVISGTVRPLRITDADGVVSRRHLRVALVGWNVQVMDLGSANGTFVAAPGDQQRHQLAPNQPFVVRPGTQVTMGRRWLRYESYRNP